MIKVQRQEKIILFFLNYRGDILLYATTILKMQIFTKRIIKLIKKNTRIFINKNEHHNINPFYWKCQ